MTNSYGISALIDQLSCDEVVIFPNMKTYLIEGMFCCGLILFTLDFNLRIKIDDITISTM